MEADGVLDANAYSSLMASASGASLGDRFESLGWPVEMAVNEISGSRTGSLSFRRVY
jgi:hypothetical protein